jgi:hypothetical protein
MPIGTFIDHGTPNAEAVLTSQETRDAFDAYARTRGKAPHLEPRPGDRLPLQDIEAIVVSSTGTTLVTPLPKAGDHNAACQDHAPPPGDPLENPRSTGVVIRYGKFRFLDVGDQVGREPGWFVSSPQSTHRGVAGLRPAQSLDPFS